MQAVIAELGAGRLLVVWSDPDDKAPTPRTIARRAAIGAGLGAAAAALLIAIALATGAATFHAVASVGFAPLLIGLVVACLLAVRDELVLRGAVLRALDGAVPGVFQLFACGLAAAALAWGTSQGAPVESACAGALGVAFAALWKLDRGAWLPWGANAAFRFVTLTVTQGALLDVRATPGAWGGGDGGLLAGRAGLVVAAAVGLVATAVYVRKIRRPAAVE